MSDRTLIDQVIAGNRRALSRLISRIDDGEPAESLPAATPPRSALKVAITGSAGVGKSTLIAALVKHLRGEGKRVAVLACDPSSPVTGGALLGDRVRIDEDPHDANLYVRSIATRGSTGGVSETAGPIARLLERFGFEIVLIETIGVGQDQVAAREIADLMLLVITPQSGDEVQWQKAGVVECADLIAVNKADLGGADSAARGVRQVTGVNALPVSGETGQGVAELWSALAALPARS